MRDDSERTNGNQTADGADAGAERMCVVTRSGPTVPCANFKAIDSGVLLFEDEKRKRVSGFVPHDELLYVLPAAVLAEDGRTLGGEAEEGFQSELTVLGGLGETYARRLHDAGIDSLAALRDADAATVATAATVAESRARRWRAAANEREAAGRDTASESESDSAASEDESTDDAGTGSGPAASASESSEATDSEG